MCSGVILVMSYTELQKNTSNRPFFIVFHLVIFVWPLRNWCHCLSLIESLLIIPQQFNIWTVIFFSVVRGSRLLPSPCVTSQISAKCTPPNKVNLLHKCYISARQQAMNLANQSASFHKLFVICYCKFQTLLYCTFQSK